MMDISSQNFIGIKIYKFRNDDRRNRVTMNRPTRIFFTVFFSFIALVVLMVSILIGILTHRPELEPNWSYSGFHKRYQLSDGSFAIGWLDLDGNRYYFDEDANLVTGWFTLDGLRYYSDADGVLQIGWFTLDEQRYYSDFDGAVQTGFQDIEGKSYYFDVQGIMQTGWFTLDEKKRFATQTGELLRGWLHWEENLYYFTTDYVMATGEIEIDGILRTFESDGRMSQKIEGIDVSQHQGVIDWDQVKASEQVDFVMIRAAFGNSNMEQEDDQFQYNFEQARRNQIPIGLYHYSYALTAQEAVMEAELCLSVMERVGVTPQDLSLPIAFDVEDPKMESLSKEELTEIIRGFCDTIKSAGYEVMIYSNNHWLSNKLDLDALSDYPIWMAQYYLSPTFYNMKLVDMWQYTSEGQVDGISKNVDRNILFDGSILKQE